MGDLSYGTKCMMHPPRILNIIIMRPPPPPPRLRELFLTRFLSTDTKTIVLFVGREKFKHNWR